MPADTAAQLRAEADTAEATARRLRALADALERAPAPALAPAPADAPAADRLLTAEEVARLVGTSARWVYAHYADMPFTRHLGKRMVRYSEVGVRRFLARVVRAA